MPWTPEQREISGRVAEFMETTRGKSWGDVHGCVLDVIRLYVSGVCWSGTARGQLAQRLAESVVTGADIPHKGRVLTAEQWDAMIADIEKCPEHTSKKRKQRISNLSQEQLDRFNSNVEF